MVNRLIRSVIETVRPPRVKIEFVDDLRSRTFEIGDDIETVVAVTPRRDAAHVVEARVALVLEFECVREAEDRTEEAFSVRFSPENIPELSSVKAIVDELV
ncbi:MAG: hypothetical protein IIB27_04165 [Chloroflexi bacterium]|nr:hypothetical protein [Chloroflexota bacterium]